MNQPTITEVRAETQRQVDAVARLLVELGWVPSGDGPIRLRGLCYKEPTQ